MAEDDAPLTNEEMSAARPSALKADLQLRLFKAWFRDDASHSSVWRREAREDFDFRAGHQWTADEKSQLKDQLRPEIVFNRSITLIKAVAGFEINSRHEIQFLPRNTQDTAVNEVLTGCSKWMGDECDGEDEESEAFEDALTCGMGWCLSDDAMVRLPDVHFATTRKYSGAVVQIDLENGKQLTGTPNHPVLTDRGWKRLCDLHEGDNLVNRAFLERIDGLPIEQFDKVESRLKDKIDAFRAGREALRFATAPDDFYADGSGSKVHVVYADSALLNKVRHAALRKKIKKAMLTGGHLLSLHGIALFAKRLIDRALTAAIGQAPLYAIHAPSAHLSGHDVVAQLMPSPTEPFADRLAVKAGSFRNFIRRKFVGKIQTNQLVGRDLRFRSAMPFAQDMASAPQSQADVGFRYSGFVPNFRDWKPLLEVEARKLCCGDGGLSQFVTRVTRRIVRQVSDFDVHDVGTAVGFFIAGDIVTSNTENRMDYEEDPAGKYVEAEISPLEMYWDYAARKKNLSDARRIARLRKIARADAKDMFPDAADEDLDARWAVGTDPEEETKTLEQKRVRDENAADNFTERDEVHIVQIQWWEREPFWIVADPVTNKRFDLDDDKYQLLKERCKAIGLPLKAVKMKRRRFKQAFVGNAVLECGDAPCPTEFIFRCITGEPDKNKGTWFGLIRVMRDPQKWANKWLSQTLHIMNSNAKGGIMAEPDAFEDQRQAEESYAKPEAITWLKKGALSGANGAKWAKKPAAEFPAGFFQLLEFSISSLRDVTGINLELLGQRDVNQPGILEAQRKQAGMTVLATMFDSLRRFRKQVGRIRLYFIQNYLNDGRLIRVIGPEGAKVIPLLRDKTLGEYDVHVDETPTSPNQKQANWAVIAPMIPMFKDQLVQNPMLFATILDYSPLPSRMVEVIKAVLLKPNPDAEQNKKLMIEKLVAAISKDQSTAEMQNAKAGATQATAMYDLAMARHLLTGGDGDKPNPLKDALDTAKTAAEIDTERATAENIRARTSGEHADSAHSRVKAMVDALTPIPQPQAPQPVAA